MMILNNILLNKINRLFLLIGFYTIIMANFKWFKAAKMIFIIRDFGLYNHQSKVPSKLHQYTLYPLEIAFF